MEMASCIPSSFPSQCSGGATPTNNPIKYMAYYERPKTGIFNTFVIESNAASNMQFRFSLENALTKIDGIAKFVFKTRDR